MRFTERRDQIRRELRKKAARIIGEALLTLPTAIRDKLIDAILKHVQEGTERTDLLLALSSQEIEVSDQHKEELAKVKNNDELLRQKRRESAAKSRQKKEAWLAFERLYGHPE